jgi:hypothetical protein
MSGFEIVGDRACSSVGDLMRVAIGRTAIAVVAYATIRPDPDGVSSRGAS